MIVPPTDTNKYMGDGTKWEEKEKEGGEGEGEDEDKWGGGTRGRNVGDMMERKYWQPLTSTYGKCTCVMIMDICLNISIHLYLLSFVVC